MEKQTLREYLSSYQAKRSPGLNKSVACPVSSGNKVQKIEEKLQNIKRMVEGEIYE
jgi:hypothetical protein